MIIKLAILEKDKDYLKRLVAVFSGNYAGRLEIYSFTGIQSLYAGLAENKIDVLLASEAFDIDAEKLPRRFGFAYLVESQNVSTYKGLPAVSKYQKAEHIYKRVLAVYAEKVESVSEYTYGGNGSVRLLAFLSAAGGTGRSSIAAASARYLAQKGDKTLYVNLETIAGTDIFFKAGGEAGFAEVIDAVKKGKGTASMLESYVRKDSTGVYFYSPSSPLKTPALNAEETEGLFTALRASAGENRYKYIVIDADFSLDEKGLALFKNASRLFFVCDGREISNKKFLKAYAALEELEIKHDLPLRAKVGIIYNRFSQRGSKKIEGMGDRELGGVNPIQYATPTQIMKEMLSKELFQNLYRSLEK